MDLLRQSLSFHADYDKVILSHHISLFWVHEELDKIVRCFWWGHDVESRKFYLIAWDRICQPKWKGGLGIRDFECTNLALLAKLAWRVITQPSSLVSSVLKAKYCDNSNFLECNWRSGDYWIWKGISRGRDFLKQDLAKIIGTGDMTNIWTDNWAGTKEFKLYPPISSEWTNEDFEKFMVSDLIDPYLKQWNVDKIRQLIAQHQWTEALTTPISIFQNEDKICWSFTSTGEFSVKSAFGLAKGLNSYELHDQQGMRGTQSDVLAKSGKWTFQQKFIFFFAKLSITHSLLMLKDRRLFMTHLLCVPFVMSILRPQLMCFFYVYLREWSGLGAKRVSIPPNCSTLPCLNGYISLFLTCNLITHQSSCLSHVGILWLIWKHRCEIIFQKAVKDPTYILRNVDMLIGQWCIASSDRKRKLKLGGFASHLNGAAKEYRQNEEDRVELSKGNAIVDYDSITMIQSDGSWVIRLQWDGHGRTQTFNSRSGMGIPTYGCLIAPPC